MAQASVASSEPKEELDSQKDTCVVGDKCLVICDHNRPVNVYHYNPKDGHRSAKTVDATAGYQDLQSRQKYILIINQVICINGPENHLLCPTKCHQSGVQSLKSPST